MSNTDISSGLELMFDLSPDPLCLLGSNGCFLMANKVFMDASGQSEEELLSGNFLNFIHPEDKEDTDKQLRSLSLDNAVCQFENRFLHTNGGYRWFSWNTKKLQDHTFYVSGRSISKSSCASFVWSGRVADKTLVKPGEDYSLLFYSNPLPMVIYDQGTMVILDCNQKATELYGYSRQDLLKLTIKDIRAAEDIPLIVETVKNRKFNKEIDNLGTWNHKKKDGSPIKVEVTGHSVEYMDRHCMIVVCNDITDLSKTMRSLELSIERFEYVTEATSDIVWDWDLETNEVYYSGNIKKSFGHTPGVNVGDMRFFAQHVHPDDRERVVLYADPVKYGTMKYWTEEYRFKKANGEYAFVLDKGIVIRDKKGVGKRMIGAMQDITILKQNELHILYQKDQLMEIARINAHEIRRPVANILGLIPLLDKTSVMDESNLEVLDYLETTTMELDAVIKRIIDKTID